MLSRMGKVGTGVAAAVGGVLGVAVGGVVGAAVSRGSLARRERGVGWGGFIGLAVGAFAGAALAAPGTTATVACAAGQTPQVTQ
jgi:hypothetical protein